MSLLKEPDVLEIDTSKVPISKYIRNVKDFDFSMFAKLDGVTSDQLQTLLAMEREDVYDTIITPSNCSKWEEDMSKLAQLGIQQDVLPMFLQQFMRHKHYSLNVELRYASKKSSQDPKIPLFPEKYTFTCTTNGCIRQAKSRIKKEKEMEGKENEKTTQERREEIPSDEEEDAVAMRKKQREELSKASKCNFKITFVRIDMVYEKSMGKIVTPFYRLLSYSPLNSHTPFCFAKYARRSETTMNSIMAVVLSDRVHASGYIKAMATLFGCVDVCGKGSIYSTLYEKNEKERAEYYKKFLMMKSVDKEEKERIIEKLQIKDEETKKLVQSLCTISASSKNPANFDIYPLETTVLCIPFVFQNQLTLLREYGDIIYVDGLHDATKQRQKLMTICVSDNADRTRLAGQAIAMEESTVVMLIFFDFIKTQYHQAFKEDFAPKYICADGAVCIHHAAQTIFKDIKSINCVFHKKNILRKTQEKLFPAYGADMRAKVVKSLNECMCTWCKTAYEICHPMIQAEIQHLKEELEKTDPKSKTWTKINKTLSSLMEYCGFYTSQNTRLVSNYIGGTFASSRIEGKNKKLRDKGVYTQSPTSRVVMLLAEEVEEERIDVCLFKYHDNPETERLLEKETKMKISGGIAGRFHDRAKKSTDFYLHQTNENASEVTYTIKHKQYQAEVNEVGKRVTPHKPRGNEKLPIVEPEKVFALFEARYEYTITKHNGVYTCDCNRGIASGYPCKHLICLFRQLSLKFTPEYFHPRFYMRFEIEPPPEILRGNDHIGNTEQFISLSMTPLIAQRDPEAPMEPFSQPGDVNEIWSEPITSTGEIPDSLLFDEMKRFRDLWARSDPRTRLQILETMKQARQQFEPPPPESTALYNNTGETSGNRVHFSQWVDGKKF